MAATGFSSRSPRPWRDPLSGDAWTWPRRYDETDTYRVDLADLLDSSETCSSVSIVDRSGPTISSSSVTSAGLLSVTVTAGYGTATARVVTSASRTLEVPLQWRTTDYQQRDRYAS